MLKRPVSTESYRESLLNSLKDPGEAAQYLDACLKDADPRVFLMALRDVADDTQRRVESLAERANEGLLSEEERAEYEAAVNAADFIAVLKLKAIRNLEPNDDP